MLLTRHRRGVRPAIASLEAHLHVSFTSPPPPPFYKPLPTHTPLLTFSYPQIEKNKSIQLSQFFTSSYATGGALRDTGFEFDNETWNHIEACFPFDPIQLPVAKRWLDLQNNYLTWESIAVLNKKPEAHNSDDVEEDGEEDDDEDLLSDHHGDHEDDNDEHSGVEDKGTDDGEE